MEYGFSIIMFCLSAGLFLYALIIRFGGYGFIPRGQYSDPKDKKAYSVYVAKVLALIAIAPAASGVVGLFGEGFIGAAVIVLIAGVAALMIIGVRFLK